jgi:hypothetical protein
VWSLIGKLVGGLLIALATVGLVFMVGMRTKSPLVLNAVRRTKSIDETVRDAVGWNAWRYCIDRPTRRSGHTPALRNTGERRGNRRRVRDRTAVRIKH